MGIIIIVYAGFGYFLWVPWMRKIIQYNFVRHYFHGSIFSIPKVSTSRKFVFIEKLKISSVKPLKRLRILKRSNTIRMTIPRELKIRINYVFPPLTYGNKPMLVVGILSVVYHKHSNQLKFSHFNFLLLQYWKSRLQVEFNVRNQDELLHYKQKKNKMFTWIIRSSKMNSKIL